MLTGTYPCRIRDFHPLWCGFPDRFRLGTKLVNAGPTTPRGEPLGLGWIRFRSPLLTESLLLSFPGGNEMFQFPPFAAYTYGFSAR